MSSFCIYCEQELDTNKFVEFQTYGMGDCECCEKCRDDRFVISEELDQWFDTEDYLIITDEVYFGDMTGGVSHKEINRKYVKVDKVITPKTTKKELKKLLLHFGFRIKYFDKLKKQDIYDKIMKLYNNNWNLNDE